MTAVATEQQLRGPFKKARARFARQHDHLSVTRQRRIADLACVMNIVIAGLYVVAVDHWDWHLSVPPGRWPRR
jgi:hypothetical protein